jgi:hypothetical protein
MVVYNSIKEISNDRINWENWDRIVARTRAEIAEVLSGYVSPQRPSRNVKCYLYSSDGELVKQIESKSLCSKYLNGNVTTVANYVQRQWIYNGFLLSQETLTKDVAAAMYRDRLAHGKVFIPNERKKRIPLYSYNKDGKLVGAYDSKYQWQMQHKKGTTLLKKGDRVIDDRLISENRYDEETARRIYKEVEAKEPHVILSYVYTAEGELVKERARTKEVQAIVKADKNGLYRCTERRFSYLNGYVISRTPITPTEAQEIALNATKRRKP